MGARYAGVLGFVAFGLTIARGLIDGQGLSLIPPACAALAVFAAIGAVAGKIGERVVDESVRQNMRAEVAAFEKTSTSGK